MPYLFIALILLAAWLSFRLQKLTAGGAVTGALVAMIIYAGSGPAGLSALALFFVLGTAGTMFRRGVKKASGMAQEPGSRRTAGQVVANGGVAALVALIILLFPVWLVPGTMVLFASFSSALADTLSSELGTVYGSKFYEVLSFKTGIRGRDGVISLEGTLIGIGGSLLMAGLFVLYFGWSASFGWIVLAGTFGNLLDSVLGATLERKNRLGNNGVNFLNTMAAALIACLALFK
jgi:uncharacterized protein (TIGR00297 family)